MKYIYEQKPRDTAKTELQFINNKVLKIVYMHNGNKLAHVMVAYLLEEMLQLHAF